MSGKIFATFIAVSGVGLVAYSIGQFSRIMIETQLQKSFGRRKLVRSIQNLKNHYIICGYGRVGPLICKELMHGKVPFVIIEKNHDVIDHIRTENDKYLFVCGDATNEKILMEAGVAHAKGLATSTTNIAENVYIILTARDLNPKIHLISLATDERSAENLRRAGAHLVISPTEIGGRRIVQGIVRPSVMDFIDLAVYDSNLELQMEEIEIHKHSPLANSTLLAGAIRQKFDVIILGIKTNEGRMLFNPDPQYHINIGDTLIALGKTSNMERIAKTIS